MKREGGKGILNNKIASEWDIHFNNAIMYNLEKYYISISSIKISQNMQIGG